VVFCTTPFEYALWDLIDISSVHDARQNHQILGSKVDVAIIMATFLQIDLFIKYYIIVRTCNMHVEHKNSKQNHKFGTGCMPL
jgi:hypothetical protein